MYQSETTYFVEGFTVTGAAIHLASPEVRAVMVIARLFAPSLPPSFHCDVVVLVPHLSKVQFAGAVPAGVSGGGLPRGLAPIAYAVTLGSSVERTAAMPPPMSNLYRRTL